MHIESKNYDFLMYTLNAGKPVPSLYIYPVRYGCYIVCMVEQLEGGLVTLRTGLHLLTIETI